MEVNGTIISTSFVALFPVCPLICRLNLIEILLSLLEGKSVILLYCLDLVHLSNIAINFLLDFFEKASLYSIKLYIDITISIS